MEDGTEAAILSLVAELDGPIDDEHPDVAVTDDGSSWSISAFQDGALVLEKLDDSDIAPRHMRNISRAEMVRAMAMLAQGNVADLQQLDWLPGYQ
ncbi:hypothetical protein DP939_09380 [Spongiactinospora rosea]|uniref:Uncharacterized protein n=1 Tax=Spongiactinospora rosea TaxID=2248750 RepID=A0A366M2K1_9ACTN|nr:hypothetical protein [Spongiactinospora rosea]RBQ20033.1 hypothetical protein DP939_09380 [Spongiactinospora rosea]